MNMNKHVPAAVDFEVASAASRLSSILRGWTGQALEDPASARYRFVVSDGDAFAGDFWEWLFSHDDDALRTLEPVQFRDGSLTGCAVRDCLPRCGRSSSVAAVKYDGFGENAGRCVWVAQWESHFIPQEPDLEVEALRGGGFAVRWSPRAEAKADVIDSLVCFVVRNGYSMEPEED